MVHNVNDFYEMVYKRNLERQPEKSVKETHMRQFLDDSWAYLQSAEQKGGEYYIAENSRAKPMNTHQRTKSRDVSLLHRIKVMQRSLGRKGRLISDGSTAVREAHQTPSSTNDANSPEQEQIPGSMTKDSENVAFEDLSSFPVDLNDFDYPNNFNENSRPFQRPFRLI